MKLEPKYIDDVVALGALVADFSKVMRVPHLDTEGRQETDTDHTVMLAVLACAIAADKHPDYDLSLIAQFAIVHDLVEVYAGDVNTINLKDVDLAAKDKAEKAALAKIKTRFGKTFPWLHKTIEKYEKLDTPEARFVKALDKALPGLTHILSENRIVNEAFDNAEDYVKSIKLGNERIQNFAPEQTVALDVRISILDRVVENKRKFHA